MTNRELLELAAKAAGMEGYYWYQGSQSLTIGADWGMDSKRGSAWNPLVNDGDALRLAVKLGILIAPPAYNGGWEATASAKADDGRWVDERSGTHDESTRRAIVRAAAEIGRAMP